MTFSNLAVSCYHDLLCAKVTHSMQTPKQNRVVFRYPLASYQFCLRVLGKKKSVFAVLKEERKKIIGIFTV